MVQNCSKIVANNAYGGTWETQSFLTMQFCVACATQNDTASLVDRYLVVVVVVVVVEVVEVEVVVVFGAGQLIGTAQTGR